MYVFSAECTFTLASRDIEYCYLMTNRYLSNDLTIVGNEANLKFCQISEFDSHAVKVQPNLHPHVFFHNFIKNL